MGIGRELGKKILGKLNAFTAAPTPAVRPAPVEPRPVPKAPPLGLGDPSRAVQVFGRASCSWSGRAQALLKSQGIDYAYFDLSAYGSDSVLRELKQETKHYTVPYVYLRGKFIGGYNELDEIHRLGQLEYLTLPEAERARHPLHGRVRDRSASARRLNPGDNPAEVFVAGRGRFAKLRR